ncbi:MAG: hypothetical protein H7A46_12930 [Verrucomicrobiales bacterium]|nr:hypothetical protein [Verrucomicrobiales bacterium]
MAFILSAQREPDFLGAAFEHYRAYLAAHAEAFPAGAFALATSDWYFDFRDHRCPHDAWLESLSVNEPASGERNECRATEIRVRLLGAYHDGFIEFRYSRVFRYTMAAPAAERGLGDWLYDEFRVSPDGRVIHEIEWAGFGEGPESRWLIEASDVEFEWIPS